MIAQHLAITTDTVTLRASFGPSWRTAAAQVSRMFDFARRSEDSYSNVCFLLGLQANVIVTQEALVLALKCFPTRILPTM